MYNAYIYDIAHATRREENRRNIATKQQLNDIWYYSKSLDKSVRKLSRFMVRPLEQKESTMNVFIYIYIWAVNTDKFIHVYLTL